MDLHKGNGWSKNTLPERDVKTYKVIDSDDMIDLVNDLVSGCTIDKEFMKEYNSVFSLGESFDYYVVGIFCNLITVVEKWKGEYNGTFPVGGSSSENIVARATFHPSTQFYENWDFDMGKNSFFSYYINIPNILDTQRLDNLGACISL